MIKTKTLIETWLNNEYDMESITTEYCRLKSAMWALYDNNLIDLEKMKKEIGKILKAYEYFENR